MGSNEDNKLETFCKICDAIAAERSYNNKAMILESFLRNGSRNKEFGGNTLLWIRMLIPGASQRVYNLQNKQIIKLFSRLFACDAQDMQQHLEHDGDVSETVCTFFSSSLKMKPQSQSVLHLQDVEEFLKNLEQLTKEEDQLELLRKLCHQCTALDLRMIVRLIKNDLRINAGARHILDALDANAYAAYQATRDLEAVVKKFSLNLTNKLISPKLPKNKKGDNNVGQVEVMTPISPMLANACKSVEEAFKKSPEGLFSEIKYDGERVQIHKKNNEFKFFSRNLKPVMEHKVKRFKEKIPQAFPSAGEMILDSEMILVDTVTSELLPFGSLGAHKKKEFANAEVCLFVFDCILYNGEDLTNKTFRERRQILEDNIKPIKSYVQLSECHFLVTKSELSLMTAKVLKANLEGVVLKSPSEAYKPGKRGWLKVKKDYLFGGKMADTADLVVLGGWYGSGKKGGILSIFLMGCFDKKVQVWKTVSKVHSGLDDATNEEIHNKLMTLMERSNPNKIPTWLVCKKPLLPDFVAKDPFKMPVWEITGAEFTKSYAHTASGISIRFPRITKLRDDKTAKEANHLEYLENLFATSKSNVNVDLLINEYDQDASSSKHFKVESKLNLSPNLTPKKTETASIRRSIKRELSSDAEEEKKVKIKKWETVIKIEKCDNSPLKNEFSPDKNALSISNSKISDEVIPKSRIFNNLVAFLHEDLPEKKYLERCFAANGGQITNDSKIANISFLLSTTSKVDLNHFRKLFKRSCRHLAIAWLTESLEQKKTLDYPLYAVVL